MHAVLVITQRSGHIIVDAKCYQIIYALGLRTLIQIIYIALIQILPVAVKLSLFRILQLPLKKCIIELLFIYQ